MSNGTSEGTAIEIDAYFRVNNGELQYHCPNTWRVKGTDEWHGEPTIWSPVPELTRQLQSELEKEST